MVLFLSLKQNPKPSSSSRTYQISEPKKVYFVKLKINISQKIYLHVLIKSWQTNQSRVHNDLRCSQFWYLFLVYEEWLISDLFQSSLSPTHLPSPNRSSRRNILAVQKYIFEILYRLFYFLSRFWYTFLLKIKLENSNQK